MAKSSLLLKLAGILWMYMLVSFSLGVEAQISCDTVNSDLLPCLSYVMNGGKVAAACCSGIKSLISSAKTKTDRQSICSCLKSLASRATDAQLKNAAKIPKLCGVKLSYNISRSIDCSKVTLA